MDRDRLDYENCRNTTEEERLQSWQNCQQALRSMTDEELARQRRYEQERAKQTSYFNLSRLGCGFFGL
jgi:hypothetical protein